jgi:predicted metal-dependent phosphoesterase TrpH
MRAWIENARMDKTPDLHTHSTASDGTLSPTDLIKRASAAGVEMMALTDHDTVAGIAEAARAAKAAGLTLIAGVEVSVTWNGRTVHVVGLDIDPNCANLLQGLQELQMYRVWRAEQIARRLAKAGFDGALDAARAHAKGGLIARTHFARFLVERGVAADIRGVFKHFLVHGKPGHVPSEWAALAQALEWIEAAGGHAVIAHPARYGFSRGKIQRLCREFRECGGRGLEVVSGSHSRDDAFTFARHATEQHLLASAGSDFHGPESSWIELGQLPALPDNCKPIWLLPGFSGMPANAPA